MCMKLKKTEKDRSELVPGVQTLGQRERTFLLLVDGRKSITEIADLLQGDAKLLGAKLVADADG